MNNNKKHQLSLFFLMVATVTYSQFYVGAGTGIYAFKDNYNFRANPSTSGYNFRAGYVKMYTKNLGVGLGLEYSKTKSDYLNDAKFSSTTSLVDAINSAFDYTITTEEYRENQTLSALQIPLFLHFENQIEPLTKFYSRLGVKYMLPLKFEAKGSAKKVSGSGYYPDFNLQITDLPSQGFGTVNNYNAVGNYDAQNTFLVNLEFGLSFELNVKSRLNIGIFMEKGTKSIIKNGANNSFIGYNPNNVDNRPLNGLYSSNSNADVKPNNIGLNITYSFDK